MLAIQTSWPAAAVRRRRWRCSSSDLDRFSK
jgi:hypothetical protein